MKHSTGTPTKAERERFEKLCMLGCICCRQLGSVAFPVEIHHLLSGNRRRGHAATIPLCSYHHRGTWWYGTIDADIKRVLGPSLAHGSKPFHARFGSDEELLAAVNALLAERRAA